MSTDETTETSRRRNKRNRSDDASLPPGAVAAVISTPPQPSDVSQLITKLIATVATVIRLRAFSLSSVHPHDARRIVMARMMSLHKSISEKHIETGCTRYNRIQLPPDITADTTAAKVLMNPKMFFSLTRLKPKEFLHLYSVLAPGIRSARNSDIIDSSHSRDYVHQKLHVADQLLIWFLMSDGNNPTLLALCFGYISRHTIARYADHVTDVINTILADEVTWPDADERKQSYGLFGCCDTGIALLDGTHCRIRVPIDNESAYYSAYKKYHTQNYFIAVDAHGYILYISEPFPGRANDRGSFNTTPFGRSDCPYVSRNEYIIVDGGFPGDGPLLQPFRKPQIRSEENDDIRQRMIMANESLSLDRALVEHSIHTLKNRAQSLANRYSRTRERQALLMQAAARIVNRVLMLRMSERTGIDITDL